MEKKFINELSEEERLRIGEILENMAKNYDELRKTLFVYDDENNAVDEKIYNSPELMDSFMAWIKGDDFDSIGDSIFQSGSEIPREIFKYIGITDNNE